MGNAVKFTEHGSVALRVRYERQAEGKADLAISVEDTGIGIAQNGVEALTFVEEQHPDLILLDIMMPRMDGFAVCKHLNQDLRTRHIPIIILTARTESEDIVKGFALGASDYVTKPFIAAELLARIKTHLEINQLRHMLSVCANCKKVRDEEGRWLEMEDYIVSHTGTVLSHGLCDQCIQELYGEIQRR